ncbi:Arginase/deacetylase [Exidia glandulosa HHB12029]|uniref:Arginase/deacetylase n=1 Tax=Exidia glandulosa HHB12029 TaxID=1314781 RepID=A0A165BU11_EXIGL|nr:Arginase/deacetylase [Exidia glandulosa HHB12029]
MDWLQAVITLVRRNPPFEFLELKSSQGGDHTITLPLLRGVYDIYGAVSVIHFDSHLDTGKPRNITGGPWLPDEEIPVTHGSYFWYAAQEGLLAPNQANIHVGIRNKIAGWETYENDAEVGFVISHADDIEEVGYKGIVKRILEVVGDNPVYITLDIDVVDPGMAPATGTPEIGGFTTRELKKILHGLDGLKIVGADIVEVAPPYDTQDEITSIAAANFAYEILTLMAKTPLTITLEHLDPQAHLFLIDRHLFQLSVFQFGTSFPCSMVRAGEPEAPVYVPAVTDDSTSAWAFTGQYEQFLVNNTQCTPSMNGLRLYAGAEATLTVYGPIFEVWFNKHPQGIAAISFTTYLKGELESVETVNATSSNGYNGCTLHQGQINAGFSNNTLVIRVPNVSDVETDTAFFELLTAKVLIDVELGEPTPTSFVPLRHDASSLATSPTSTSTQMPTTTLTHTSTTSPTIDSTTNDNQAISTAHLQATASTLRPAADHGGNASNHNSIQPVWYIVGAALGGAAAVILLGGSLLWCRKRRRLRESANVEAVRTSATAAEMSPLQGREDDGGGTGYFVERSSSGRVVMSAYSNNTATEFESAADSAWSPDTALSHGSDGRTRRFWFTDNQVDDYAVPGCTTSLHSCRRLRNG